MSLTPDSGAKPKDTTTPSASGSLSPLTLPPGSPWSFSFSPSGQQWLDALFPPESPSSAGQPPSSVPQPDNKAADTNKTETDSGNASKPAVGAQAVQAKPVQTAVVQATWVPIQHGQSASGSAASSNTTADEGKYTSTQRFNEEAVRKRIRFLNKQKARKTQGGALSGSKRSRIAKVDAIIGTTATAAQVTGDPAIGIAFPAKKKKCYAQSHLDARRKRQKNEQAKTRVKLSRANKRVADLEEELDTTVNKLGAAKSVITELQERAAKARSNLRVSKLELTDLEKKLAEQRIISDTWTRRVVVLSQYLGIPASAITVQGEAARFLKQ